MARSTYVYVLLRNGEAVRAFTVKYELISAWRRLEGLGWKREAHCVRVFRESAYLEDRDLDEFIGDRK